MVEFIKVFILVMSILDLASLMADIWRAYLSDTPMAKSTFKTLCHYLSLSYIIALMFVGI